MLFTRKHLCWGFFFIKVAGLQASNCIKKGLPHRHFIANFWGIYKNTYFEEHLRTAVSAFLETISKEHSSDHKLAKRTFDETKNEEFLKPVKTEQKCFLS